MIEVGEAKTAPEFKRLEELHEELLRYYGRVLRIRTTTVRQPRVSSYSSRPVPASVELTERVGKLIGLELMKTIPMGNPERLKAGLSYWLEANPSQAHTLNLDAEIQVLQEDSGTWALIHRHPEWAQLVEAVATAGMPTPKDQQGAPS